MGCIGLLGPGALFADWYEMDRGAGEASFQILKIHLDPKVVAMAGAGTALYGRALSSTDMNPASINPDSMSLYLGQGYPYRESGAMISHGIWNLDFSNHKTFFHYRYLGFGGDLPGYDADNNPTSDYSAHSLKVEFGYANRFKFVNYGAGISYVENNISWANYRTFILDLGLQANVLPGLSLGAALNNGEIFTSEPQTSAGVKPFPPTTVRAGIAYTYNAPKEIDLCIALDARTRKDEKLNFPMGVEISWKKIISLRTGYPLGEPEPAQSFGIGVQYKRLIVDYGLKRYETLSPGHFWMLGLKI